MPGNLSHQAPAAHYTHLMVGVLIGLMIGVVLGLGVGCLLWRPQSDSASDEADVPSNGETHGAAGVGADLVPSLIKEDPLDSVAVTEARETLERCLGSCYLDAEQRQWAEDALRFLHAGRLSEARDALRVVLRTSSNPRTVQYLRTSLQLLDG